MSPDWQQRVGRGTSVNWPVGLGGKGNEGVAGLVKQTPNAIGYVELIYAVQNKLPYGDVRNRSGRFVQATLESVTAAAAATAEKMPEDFRVSITDPAGVDAYPIASFTWLLVPTRIKDAQKGAAIKKFLAWMLADGQPLAAPLNYAPLPASRGRARAEGACDDRGRRILATGHAALLFLARHLSRGACSAALHRDARARGSGRNSEGRRQGDCSSGTCVRTLCCPSAGIATEPRRCTAADPGMQAGRT